MTVKVILWGSQALQENVKHEGLSMGNIIYDRREGCLIEYIYIDSNDKVGFCQAINKGHQRRSFVLVDQLTVENASILATLQKSGKACHLLITAYQIDEDMLKASGIQYWCQLRCDDQHLLDALLDHILFEEKLGVEETIKGGLLLVGKLPNKVQAGELMLTLFKEWHYVEKRKHIKLDLFSHLPLGIEMLSEVEDAANQYIAEESRFQLCAHEIIKESESLFYVVSAF